MDRSRYRALFVAEARRTLAEGAAELRRLEARGAAAPPDDPSARELLRAFHTLKGMSATMGIGAIVSVAHALEDVCQAATTGSLVLDAPARALMRSALARMENQVDEVEAGTEPVEDAPLVDAVLRHLAAAAQTGFRLLGPVEPPARPAIPADLELTDDEPTWDGPGDTFARVLAACASLKTRLAGDPQALAELQHVTQGVRALYCELAEARAVPFATVVPPLRRRLRALCGATGRDALLEVHGEDVRVDPAILGPLQAALVHLVHNAVLHGIEPAADRGAKGGVGHVSLRVEARVDHLSVEVEDDGRGLDAAALQAAAGEPGLDPVALALRPGLTTADAPGLASGRGEGLPAARGLVERLGGALDLSSTPGRGTRVHLRVPLYEGPPGSVAPSAPFPLLPPSVPLPRGTS